MNTSIDQSVCNQKQTQCMGVRETHTCQYREALLSNLSVHTQFVLLVRLHGVRCRACTGVSGICPIHDLLSDIKSVLLEIYPHSTVKST